MAEFITVNGEFAPSGMYEFSKDIYIEKDCQVSICAFAVMRYILYISGEYVCEGPCKSSENIRYYDEVKEVRLQKGRNEIKMVVIHLLQQGKFSLMMIRSLWKSWLWRIAKDSISQEDLFLVMGL